MSNKRLIIASNNAHKVLEIKELIGERFDEVLSMREAGIELDIEENGKTFRDNALIKARAIGAITRGDAVIADDSGLIVEALDGAPGVYSARFAGEPCNDRANNEKLLDLLKDVVDRRAYYVSDVVILYPDGRVFSAEGRVNGIILEDYRGDGGFGYDPLFYCLELGKTFGEITLDEKNLVSHRSRALAALKAELPL